jgi:hypothetical protein
VGSRDVFYYANSGPPGGEDALRRLIRSTPSLPPCPFALFPTHEHGVDAPVTIYVAQLRDRGAAGPHLQSSPAAPDFNPSPFESGSPLAVRALVPQLI